MKGTALRPVWPAPGGSDFSAKRSQEPQTLSRITLALLDEYAFDSRTGGYDPYNTDAGRRIAAGQDIWSRKPKRD